MLGQVQGELPNLRVHTLLKGNRFSLNIILIAALLVTMITIVYWKVGHYPFVNFDDNLYITENLVVLKGLTWDGIGWAFKSFYPNWHPLTWLSHMADVEFFGQNAGSHHLESVLIHALTTLILFLALNRATRAMWKSAFVAALFAVHPLHVESVVWISERKDVLCGLFWVITIYAYTVYVERGGRGRYIFVLLFFTMGILSKPMIVTLPFVLMLLDYWPLGRVVPEAGGGASNPDGTGRKAPFFRLFGEKIPLLFLMLCACGITYISQFAGGHVRNYPLGIRLSNSIMSWVGYIGKLLWPTSLAVFYPHPWLDRVVIPAWKLGFSIFLLAGITLMVMLWVRRRPYLAVGWFWYLGTLVPVIGLNQVGNQAMADRYTYIPSIGIFIMFAWGVPDLIRGWRFQRYILGSLGIVCLSVLIVLTTFQISYWRSAVSLFTHAEEVIPNNWRIQVNLGLALLDEGRIDEAISQFQTMLLIAPTHDEAIFYQALARNGLGMAYERKGDYDKAIAQYLETLRIIPQFATANNNLGETLRKQGKNKEAIYYFEQAVKYNPKYAVAHQNLARSLASVGVTDRAQFHLREARRLDPSICNEEGTVEENLEEKKNRILHDNKRRQKE
jgi:Tfp pilus assembly protein PilF